MTFGKELTVVLVGAALVASAWCRCADATSINFRKDLTLGDRLEIAVGESDGVVLATFVRRDAEGWSRFRVLEWWKGDARSSAIFVHPNRMPVGMERATEGRNVVVFLKRPMGRRLMSKAEASGHFLAGGVLDAEAPQFKAPQFLWEPWMRWRITRIVERHSPDGLLRRAKGVVVGRADWNHPLSLSSKGQERTGTSFRVEEVLTGGPFPDSIAIYSDLGSPSPSRHRLVAFLQPGSEEAFELVSGGAGLVALETEQELREWRTRVARGPTPWWIPSFLRSK